MPELVDTMRTIFETLADSERRRHEAILARMAQKAVLMHRKLPPRLGEEGEDSAGQVLA